jgi:hypothetical protein
MKPGQRIELIGTIAKSMEAVEWPQLDLILRQFGFPWSESWGGDSKTGYVIAHVENQSDEKLLELHQYLLGSQEGDDETLIASSPWRPQRFRLFVSYYHTYGPEAGALKIALDDYGISAYVAHNDIEPTAAWRDEILNGLLSCDALLACLTTDVRESQWVDQEVGIAIGRRLLVIPLQLGTTPYGFLNKYQGLKGDGFDASNLAKKIFEVLLGNHLTVSSIVAGLIGRLEDSDSYDTSNRIAKLLESIPNWSTQQLTRLENAFEANRQVSEAYDAKRVIRKILDTQVV